jgi:RNA recognition motif-containing protein
MGYGFVEYETTENAQKAVKMIQNKILDGHKLTVTMSRKKV